ncbi:MAG: biosynthetic arginine decarboxylase [Spirochaetia bacterium]|jgi:arginine decarboxylase|nr:biosynthetic arginine decarboxylase [Spirochaetia bacterium]
MTKVKKEMLDRWKADDSAELYGIRRWGAGYFDVSKNGDVVVTPFADKSISVSIKEIINGVLERGMDMPVLLRIENLLDAQIENLHKSFADSIKKFGYQGNYMGVFPIKVNQQQHVIDEMTNFGSKYHHGLEAGSKAELIVAISMLQDEESFIICNGYKDEEFMDLGLYATKIGIQCFFVLEMPGELDLLLKRSSELQISPSIGVRLKLSSKAGGHWSDSGGDRSIFGLNTSQLIQVVDKLREKNMLGCLKLLHYHLGSQIPNIRDIRAALFEASRVYADLVTEGAAMGYLDLGGGLAVDYDGSKANYQNSMNYSIDEYCVDVIEVIMNTLDEKSIRHPVIVTESGRATVAYSSVLLFNVLDQTRFEAQELPNGIPDDSHEFVKNLMETLKYVSPKNIQECFNDALYYRDEVMQKFKHGDLSLRERSLAETIFWNIINAIAREKKKLKNIPAALDGIDSALADIYYCNFSVFQSLPDSWAIGHIFPVLPVHHLNEEPTRNVIIADITCDCDGKINHFTSYGDIKDTLPLHELKDNEEYYIGVFLVGAYQETLGDLHNLMGDTNVVSVSINTKGDYDFVREIEGDSVADVLSYVEYQPKTLLEQFREKAEKGVRSKKITVSERRKILTAFENGLNGYTYFER